MVVAASWVECSLTGPKTFPRNSAESMQSMLIPSSFDLDGSILRSRIRPFFVGIWVWNKLYPPAAFTATNRRQWYKMVECIDFLSNFCIYLNSPPFSTESNSHCRLLCRSPPRPKMMQQHTLLDLFDDFSPRLRHYCSGKAAGKNNNVRYVSHNNISSPLQIRCFPDCCGYLSQFNPLQPDLKYDAEILPAVNWLTSFHTHITSQSNQWSEIKTARIHTG